MWVTIWVGWVGSGQISGSWENSCYCESRPDCQSRHHRPRRQRRFSRHRRMTSSTCRSAMMLPGSSACLRFDGFEVCKRIKVVLKECSEKYFIAIFFLKLTFSTLLKNFRISFNFWIRFRLDYWIVFAAFIFHKESAKGMGLCTNMQLWIIFTDWSLY